MVREPTNKLDEKEVRSGTTEGHNSKEVKKDEIKKEFKVPPEWFNADC